MTTVDLSTSANCNPAATTPGDVRSAFLFLSQASSNGGVNPDLYLDDLVVTVSDGHNLVGNPNFEAGVTDGWLVNGNGSGNLAVSSTIGFGTTTHSLAVTGRGQFDGGPRYNLPLGPGKYDVVFHGLHTGTVPHTLILQPTYTCANASAPLPAPLFTAPAVPPNTWTTLTGTVSFPPANAPPGCLLSDAAVYMQQEAGACGTGIECPDLYVDEVSITPSP
jgi:hypothetical protein